MSYDLKFFLNGFKTAKSSGRCFVCGDVSNNVTRNMCNKHTDMYIKLSRQAEEDFRAVRELELGINYTKIHDIEFDGVNHNDYPDYCDVYISKAFMYGEEMTDEQLDFINDHARDFLSEKFWEQLY